MATNPTLSLAVITPEREVLRTATAEVVIPAHDGELGVLDGRAPLMCELGIGQLRYDDGGVTRRVFIDGGFAQVNDNVVTVLTPRAIAASELTPEVVAAAEQRLADETDGSERIVQHRRVTTLRALHSAN